MAGGSRLEAAAGNVAQAMSSMADLIRSKGGATASGVLMAFDAGARPMGAGTRLGGSVTEALASAAQAVMNAAEEQVKEAQGLEDAGTDAADAYLRAAENGEGPLPETLDMLQSALHPVMDSYRQNVLPLADTPFIRDMDPGSRKPLVDVGASIDAVNDELGRLEDEYDRLIDSVREMRDERERR